MALVATIDALPSDPAASSIRSVTIVVLSHNRPELLKRSLDSVLNQSLKPHEVILVDNPSPNSDAVRSIAASYPALRFFPCEKNLGFTGGMNLGLKAAVGEFVVITEDDIEMQHDAVEQLVNLIETTPDCRFAAPVMLNIETGTVRCAGGNYELRSWPEMTIYGKNDRDVSKYEYDRRVGYVPGACIAAKKSSWRQVGFFLERYFMYSEDVDLCLTAAAMGMGVWVAGKSKVGHFEPSESGTVPDWLTKLKLLNKLRLYGRHAPALTLWLFLFNYVWLFIVRPFPWQRSQSRASTASLISFALELPTIAKERRFLQRNHRNAASEPALQDTPPAQ